MTLALISSQGCGEGQMGATAEQKPKGVTTAQPMTHSCHEHFNQIRWPGAL